MKKEHKILVGAILVSIILTALVTNLFCVNKKTNQPQAVSMTNAPVVVQTNTPSQVDLLAAEVRALKAANEEREARVKRLLALNEEVRREREMATNVITIPINITVTNTPPTVNINGTLNIGGSSAPPALNKESKKGGTVLMEKAQKSKTRAPMYTITNSTSSVTVSGTNTVSETKTSVQNYLYPPKRSLLGAIFGGQASPIPTDTLSGNTVQQRYQPEVVVVEQPPVYYSGYPYAYGYPYGYGGYGYRSVPVHSQSCERRLFGVRFHAR